MSNKALLYLMLICVYLYPNYRILVLYQDVIYPFLRNVRSGNNLMLSYSRNLENTYEKIWKSSIRSPFFLASASDDDKTNQDSSSEESKAESQLESNSTKINEKQDNQKEAAAETPEDSPTNTPQAVDEVTKTPEDNQTNRSQADEEVTPRPRSRIETYDEFARFRNSSRAPDSHYPLGPGPGYRRSHGIGILYKNTLILLIWLLLVIF